jgi:hypothetical protein
MGFRIAVCGLTLLAGLISQGHAAQSVSAPVLLSQSTEPTGAYYEQNGSNVCGTGGYGSSSGASGSQSNYLVCKIDFAAPPTGKYLVVEHVACNLRLEGIPLTDVSLAATSGTNEVRVLPLEPTLEAQNGDYYYSLNDSVLYATRTVPRIVLNASGPTTLHMTCQISGHLNANQ